MNDVTTSGVLSPASYQDFISSKLSLHVPVGFTPSDLSRYGLFDFQEAIVDWAVKRGRAAIFADTGLGKEQPVTEPVLTPSGWLTMGDLRVGDYVIGYNGLPTQVTGVFPQGVKRVYRIELSDGSFVRAGQDHLWAVRTKVQRYRGESFEILTTQQIADSIHRDWQLPMFSPVPTDDVDLPIHPYALGVMLGDGQSSEMTYLCTDNWIGDYLGWRKTGTHDTCNYVGYFAGHKDILEKIGDMGLRKTSCDKKFVPDLYLHASPYQRLELLNGLMDTDGYPMPDGGSEFSSTSRNLVDSVCSLVRSLGGVARGLRECASTFTYKGETRHGKQAWRVNLKLPNGMPMFKLPRKAEKHISPSKYPPARIIRAVVDEWVDENQVCIKVDAADSLYVTRDYIITHNTRMQLAFADQVATHTGKPVLILAPLCVAQQTVREAQRIGIADCRYARTKALVIGSRIVIVNYEMLEHFAGVRWGGVVLDESSILKSFEGKIRNAIISQFADTDYRLSCTATPSPNDFMELGNQAEFLGVMSRTEMLAQFFIHDGGDTSQWRLKGHGKTVFWQWMSTWAVCIRSPADLGFDGSRYILPPLNTYQHTVDAPFVPDNQLFSTVALTLNDRRAAKRVSIADRVKAVVLLIKSENDKIALNLQNNQGDLDGLEKGISGESGSKDCRRPGVSGEVSATDQERPGEAKSLSSGVLQGESREVQDNARTAGRAQCCTETEVRGRCGIQGDCKTESEGMARCESDQKEVATHEKLRNPDNGLSGFASKTKRGVRDLRVLGYEQPEDVPGSRSLPQDRECQGSALHELQSGIGEIQGQHRISDIGSHVSTLPKWVIWCHLNPEQDALESALKENGIAFVSIRGATKIEEKIKLESDWRLGSVQVMLTKPSVFGFGMNWQCCSNVCFVGLDDSYEAYYQSVRRCYRFGQTRPVEVHIISSEGEGAILKNIERKAAQAQEMSAAMVEHMREFSQREVCGAHRETNDYVRDVAGDEDWTLHLGDCVDVVSEMESNSIGYTIFSPPFASLYTYSNSHRDMGNCRGHSDFYQHFRFLVDELLRVTQAGRLLSFHCTNIPMMKGRDGQIGIHDFRGEMIKLFVDAGWIFHSEVVIWKDPVTAMQRTKALGLLYKQLRKDSCMSRMGIPDYLVTMRKPGVNHDPVTKTHDGFPVSLWQQYASPVWMDINPTRTLQYRAARDNDDERHIAPLQLDVIERAIELWSNPGDVVCSPFAGIGSEGYVALQMGRRFVGAELKRSYFEVACRNLASAHSMQGGLFAEDEEPINAAA